MSGAGDLHERVAFDAPFEQTDVYGDVQQGFQDAILAYHCSAHFLFLKGGETVQASRLAGRQPVVVTIRNSAKAREITPAWRMRDLRLPDVYNIRSIVPSPDSAWLELTCEKGVAA